MIYDPTVHAQLNCKHVSTRGYDSLGAHKTRPKVGWSRLSGGFGAVCFGGQDFTVSGIAVNAATRPE